MWSWLDCATESTLASQVSFSSKWIPPAPQPRAQLFQAGFPDPGFGLSLVRNPCPRQASLSDQKLRCTFRGPSPPGRGGSPSVHGKSNVEVWAMAVK